MFNLAKGIFKSPRNQNQPVSGGASGSKSSIQAPNVSSELLETQRKRELADADILKDTYFEELNKTHKSNEKNINQWVMQAPVVERENRQKAAESILTALMSFRPSSFDMYPGTLSRLLDNPKDLKTFFDGLGKLSQLQDRKPPAKSG